MRNRCLAVLLAAVMTFSIACGYAEGDLPAATVSAPTEQTEKQTTVSEPQNETKEEKQTEVSEDKSAETPKPTAAQPTEEPEQRTTPKPVQPVDEPGEMVTSANTEEATAAPTEAPAAETPAPTATAEVTAEPTAEPTPVPTQTATPEPTAELSPSPTAEPLDPLKIDFASQGLYAFVGKKPIQTDLFISGGDGCYSVVYTISCDDREIDTVSATVASNGYDQLTYKPTEFGKHTIRAEVSDGSGMTAVRTVRIPVAEVDRHGVDDWRDHAAEVELSGDWGADLVALALSQLGYEESTHDFIIDADGRHGFTIYSSAAGGGYYEWCAAFIGWCVDWMELEDSQFPTTFRVRDWRDTLTDKGVYIADVAEFTPQRGDIIFFSSEGNAEYPHHVGIVEKVENGEVCTIEGNVGGAVRQKSYELTDETIVGYADVSELQRIWEKQNAPDAERGRLTERAAQLTEISRIPMLSEK